MKVLFSSDKSVESLRKRILRNYNILSPKEYEDPQRPNAYRAYLENTTQPGYELSTLSNRDNDDLTRAYEQFYLRPTIATARALTGTTHKRRRRTKSIPTDTVLQEKRVRRGGAAGLTDATLNAMMYTDALHDLGKEYKHWVFQRVDHSIIPPDSVHARNITWTVAQSWLHFAGLTYDANFSAKAEDALPRWREQIAQSGEITICIDGFLHNMQWKTPHDLFRNTLLETLMLLLIVYDNNITCKKLVIVDGGFNELDGFYFYKHIQDYIEYLSGLVKGVVVVKTYVKFPQPAFLPMQVDADYVTLVNGDKILHNTTEMWVYINRDQLTTFHYPYEKSSLVRMFKEFYKSDDDKVQSVLENAVSANFFRDAYRIDLALQHKWVFITHDRLAFLLYSILAASHGLPNLGLFIGRDRQASIAAPSTTDTSLVLIPKHVQCLFAK